jgi:hypothetical protein
LGVNMSQETPSAPEGSIGRADKAGESQVTGKTLLTYTSNRMLMCNAYTCDAMRINNE